MSPVEIMREVERLAEQKLWSGFEITDIPVAIYDGKQTWLFRHPAPPDPFMPHPDHDEVYVMDGRHPSVVANSIAMINDQIAATVMLEGVQRTDLSGIASIVIHEMFHVYQAIRHPDWNADVSALFLYPFDRAELLQLRRLETEAIHRALHMENAEESIAWCRHALQIREHRFRLLPPEAVLFERNTERHEGLAHYIELKALGKKTVAFPEEEYAPDGIRGRCYLVGCAWAQLLDRLDPDWPEQLAEKNGYLDERLGSILDTRISKTVSVDFTSAEKKSAYLKAVSDIVSWNQTRDSLKREFFATFGWKLAIETKTPLRTWGIDPSNAQKLNDAEVLHTRFIRLGSQTDRIEMLKGSALTVGAGAHPLFDGIQSAVFQLVREPRAEFNDETVEIESEGFKAQIRKTNLQRLSLDYVDKSRMGGA
jgi:hypothetical protein